MGIGGQMIIDVLLIVGIIILAALAMGDYKKPVNYQPKDKDVPRIRQMKEWDRFDDKNKN